MKSATRGLRALTVPVLAFGVWRFAHLVIVAMFGGGWRDATFNFDGGWYLSILQHGYSVPEGGFDEFSNTNFFPGLPWLTELVQIVVRNETAAATITVNLLALAAFVCVWGAIRSWTDGQVARQCVIGLALAPTSYYLWMYYAEGLLVATAAGAAWAARRSRHGWTVLAIAGAATARAPGIAVGPSLAIARVLQQRKIDRIAILYAVAPLLGVLPVMAMQSAQVGDGLAWTRAGRAWGRELAAPWTPILAGIHDIIDTLPKPAEGVALDLAVIFFVGLGASWLLVQARRANTPWDPGVLAATAWATALSSRLAASQIRYALAAWPVLIAVVQLLERVPRWVRTATVLGSSLLSVLLLRRLALGDFTA